MFYSSLHSSDSKDSRRVEKSKNRSYLVRGESCLAQPSYRHSHRKRNIGKRTCFSPIWVRCTLTNLPLLSWQKKRGWPQGSGHVSRFIPTDSLTGGSSMLAALMKPSMYFILHSTGVCLNCQSDFSGLKNKTHGICHLERAYSHIMGGLNDCILYNKNVLEKINVIVKSRLSIWCWMQQFCTSTERGPLLLSYLPALRQPLNGSALIALKSYCRSTERWQLHFMPFGLSLTEVVMSSPCFFALASRRQSNYIMTPKFPRCHTHHKQCSGCAKILVCVLPVYLCWTLNFSHSIWVLTIEY